MAVLVQGSQLSELREADKEDKADIILIEEDLEKFTQTQVETVLAVRAAEKLAESKAEYLTEGLSSGSYYDMEVFTGSLVPAISSQASGEGGGYPIYVNPILLSQTFDELSPANMSGVFVGVVGHDRNGEVTINAEPIDTSIYEYQPNEEYDEMVIQVGVLSLESDDESGKPYVYPPKGLRAIGFDNDDMSLLTPGHITFGSQE